MNGYPVRTGSPKRDPETRDPIFNGPFGVRQSLLTHVQRLLHSITYLIPVEDFPPQFLVLRLKNVGTAHITGVSFTIQYTIEDLKNILQPTFYEQSISLTEGIAPGAERRLWVFEITHLPAVYYEIKNLTFFDHTGRVRYDYTGQISDELINNLLEVETNG